MPGTSRRVRSDHPAAPHFFRVDFFFALFEGVLPRDAVFAAATWAAFTRWSVTGADFFTGFLECEWAPLAPTFAAGGAALFTRDGDFEAAAFTAVAAFAAFGGAAAFGVATYGGVFGAAVITAFGAAVITAFGAAVITAFGAAVFTAFVAAIITAGIFTA